MYTAKETSTNQLNKSITVGKCMVSFTFDKIGGRWKPLIIFQLSSGPVRYAALKRAVAGITEKMLIQNLRELENDSLVAREVKAVVPPHVTYSLTPSGRALKPLFDAMAEWGAIYSRNEMAALEKQV
jgi:DNA-binding HxlR family transcriptional regulator